MDEPPPLPNPHSAYVERQKILQYLLNLRHAIGGAKAKFFIARGFTEEQWGIMHDALVTQGTTNAVVRTTDHKYGMRFQVDCNCPTPDGSNPCIRSVWEVKSEDPRPRLITAHPV